MKVYCWYEDNFSAGLPGIDQLQEVDLQGKKHDTLCPLHPDYRAFLTGLTEDYCASYDIDGVMWGSERQGPLNYAIGAGHGGKHDPGHATCFCEFCKKAAKDRGIDVARAREGFTKLAAFVRAAQSNQ